MDKHIETKLPDLVPLNDKQYMESAEIETVAETVIKDEELDLGPANVAYFLVYPNISTTTGARAKKAGNITHYYTGAHYVIEVSGELWDMLDEQTRKRLMWHELLHLDPTYKAKKGVWAFKTRSHDFADFYEINERVGSDWYKTIQAVMSSLYDLPPKKERKVKL